MYGNTVWERETFTVSEDKNWPSNTDTISKLGEIAGLSTCPAGKLHLFHRGPVVWDEE